MVGMGCPRRRIFIGSETMGREGKNTQTWPRIFGSAI